MSIQDRNITQVLEKCKADLENFKNAKVKCGIIGRSGTGKSSLINAIVGEQVSAVGEIETTMAISEPIEHKGLLFYDLPGSSTVNFPMDTYIETMGIKNFDCVILVTADRFFEDDLYLITEISKLKIPVFPVRTKFDFSIDRALKRGITEEETYASIYADLKKSLDGYNIKGIYLTSADYPTKYDLNKLLDDISNSLNSIKRERFIADVNVISLNLLKEKRDLSTRLVSRYAALSAANGLNPIPGLDISVDLGLLYKMSTDIQEIYGLKKEQIHYSSSLLTDNKSKLIIAKAVQFTSKYVGKEAILLLLKKAGLSFAGKGISKWIPFVGQAIAAGLGFKLTSSIGNNMLTDAEEIAAQTFEAIKGV
jgi:GTP-binding protein EngB required for normal cell division